MRENREFGPEQLERLFSALGELLEDEGVEVRILVVGGAALTLGGWIPPRTTQDVDVLARVEGGPEGHTLQPPTTLPEAFHDAVRRVARDFDLTPNWVNSIVGAQWTSGLPPTAATDIQWRRYGFLEVGLAGRQTLIDLKLFAAVDRGRASVHYQDLVALAPTETELMKARSWVEGQDTAPIFLDHLRECIDHVRRDLGRDPEDRD